jgi:hypothetical protein
VAILGRQGHNEDLTTEVTKMESTEDTESFISESLNDIIHTQHVIARDEAILGKQSNDEDLTTGRKERNQRGHRDFYRWYQPPKSGKLYYYRFHIIINPFILGERYITT